MLKSKNMDLFKHQNKAFMNLKMNGHGSSKHDMKLRTTKKRINRFAYTKIKKKFYLEKML